MYRYSKYIQNIPNDFEAVDDSMLDGCLFGEELVHADQFVSKQNAFDLGWLWKPFVPNV